MVQEQIQQSMTKSSQQTREFTRRLSKFTEAQSVIGWTIILLLVAVLGVIYVNQSSQMATVGQRVQSLQYDLSVLHRENAEIEREIAEVQTLSRLQKGADEMGFIPTQAYDMEYLVIENYPAPIAMHYEETAQKAAPAPPVETASEALWLVINNKINDLMYGEWHE